MARGARGVAALLALLLRVETADGAVAADEIDGPSLPGYGRAFPNGARHYSGYVNTSYPGRAGVTVHTHYHLIVDAASDAPLLQWQQGGPGGSSLIGLFTEMGPLTLNDASWGVDDSFQVFDNPHGWQNATGGASLLFLEHPAPTGFSFCEPADACSHDDDSQAELHLEILEAFFSDVYYPELREKRYVAAGESYAGVLVPTLAAKILAKRNATNRHAAPYSLEGFALGNDCPGNKVYTCTPYSGWAGTQISLDFLYGHGMIPDGLKSQIDDACADWYVAEPPGPQTAPPTACSDLLEDPIRPVKSVAGDTYEMGGGYFLYDTCASDLLARDPETHGPQRAAASRPSAERVAAAGYANDAGEYSCGQENAAGAWLNVAAVQDALHVAATDFSFSTGLNYNFTAASLLEEYASTLVPNFRILQYSGDADPCVPMPGTQKWIASLANRGALQELDAWHPWTAPDTMAVTGYATTFAPNFSFATIRDAGHMSPRYKPKELLFMIDSWLRQRPL